MQQETNTEHDQVLKQPQTQHKNTSESTLQSLKVDMTTVIMRERHSCPPAGHWISTHPKNTSPSPHRTPKQPGEEMCFSTAATGGWMFG